MRATAGIESRTDGVTGSSAGRLEGRQGGGLSIVGAALGDVANDPVLASSAEDLGVSWVGLNAVLPLAYAIETGYSGSLTQQQQSSKLVE